MHARQTLISKLNVLGFPMYYWMSVGNPGHVCEAVNLQVSSDRYRTSELSIILLKVMVKRLPN